MTEKNQPQFSLLAKIVNGGIAGIIGVVCFYPLDLVKTRLQNQHLGPHAGTKYFSMIDAFKKTYKAEGLLGMYRGAAITMLFITPKKAFQLAANDLLRYHMQNADGQIPLYKQMIAGGLAGLLQVITTTPMELLKVQMQDVGRIELTSKSEGKAVEKASARDLAMDIIRQKGIIGLYKGIGVTTIRDVSFAMLFFPLFATLNELGPKRTTESDESVLWWSFISGYISGSFAAVAVTPFDVIKTRRQALAKAGGEISYTGIGQAIVKILRLEGPTALFKGGFCRLLVIAPSFGITQAIYYIGIAEYLLGFKK